MSITLRDDGDSDELSMVLDGQPLVFPLSDDQFWLLFEQFTHRATTRLERLARSRQTAQSATHRETPATTRDQSDCRWLDLDNFR
jgi:hypothetical protein